MRPEVLVTFLVPVIRYMTKTTYIRKRLFFLLRYCGEGMAGTGRELSTQVCGQEAERDERRRSVHLLCIHRIPADGSCCFTFRVALPSSAKSLWRRPHRACTYLLENPKCSQVGAKMNPVTWILLCGVSETAGLTASKTQPGGSQNS